MNATLTTLSDLERAVSQMADMYDFLIGPNQQPSGSRAKDVDQPMVLIYTQRENGPGDIRAQIRAAFARAVALIVSRTYVESPRVRLEALIESSRAEMMNSKVSAVNAKTRQATERHLRKMLSARNEYMNAMTRLRRYDEDRLHENGRLVSEHIGLLMTEPDAFEIVTEIVRLAKVTGILGVDYVR